MISASGYRNDMILRKFIGLPTAICASVLISLLQIVPLALGKIKHHVVLSRAPSFLGAAKDFLLVLRGFVSLIVSSVINSATFQNLFRPSAFLSPGRIRFLFGGHSVPFPLGDFPPCLPMPIYIGIYPTSNILDDLSFVAPVIPSVVAPDTQAAVGSINLSTLGTGDSLHGNIVVQGVENGKE
jgi:hypothetical protein